MENSKTLKESPLSPSLKKAIENLNAEYGMAVITGASSGIGEAVAEALLAGGKNIFVCNLSRTQSSIINDSFCNISCDVSEVGQMDAAFEVVKKIRNARGLGGKKTLLINNSGFGAYGFFPEPCLAHNVAMIDVNIRGLTYMSGKFMEILRQSGGGIINVASTAAFQPCPYLNVYAATKVYVMNFSLALDYELRKFGCTCLCLCPGPTSTRFFKRAGFATRPLKVDFGHTSSQVAEACLIAFSKGRNLKIVGCLNFLQAFMINFVPRRLVASLSGWILSKFRN